MFCPISQTLNKLAARIPANQATVLGKAYANLTGPNSAGTFSKNFSQMMMDKAKATAANKESARVSIYDLAKKKALAMGPARRASLNKAKANAANKESARVSIYDLAKKKALAMGPARRAILNTNPSAHKFDKPFAAIRGAGWN